MYTTECSFIRSASSPLSDRHLLGLDGRNCFGARREKFLLQALFGSSTKAKAEPKTEKPKTDPKTEPKKPVEKPKKSAKKVRFLGRRKVYMAPDCGSKRQVVGALHAQMLTSVSYLFRLAGAGRAG